MAVMISRVEVSRPPGVSSSTTRAVAAARSASASASRTKVAATGWMIDATRMWTTSGAGAAAAPPAPSARKRSGTTPKNRGQRREIIRQIIDRARYSIGSARVTAGRQRASSQA